MNEHSDRAGGRNTHLIGETSTSIFRCILDHRKIETKLPDLGAFDCIVYDHDNRVFKVGQSPFFAQILCRGHPDDTYHPRGHPQAKISDTLASAGQHGIQETSLYLIAGFFKNNDIRTITYYVIPFRRLDYFKSPREYRFSFDRCEEAIQELSEIVRI